MNLRRTKYYPVDLDGRRIIDDPHQRERDAAWKYRGQRGIVCLPGKRLMQHQCYQAFTLVTPGRRA